ncbi:MAG TPA: class I SAM-dependent methyltransferase [Opitutaceae bacterium]
MNQDEYRKLAEDEDQMWYFRSLHAHVLRELAHLPPGTRVLDAGCGTGGLILRLREARPDWVWSGIDFMPLACELAQERCGPGVDIRCASVTELPFADESFDAVVSADVVCQIENPEVAAREFFRVLKPGGIVVINVPAYMWMYSYHDENCHTKHRYTRPELETLLRGGGFADRKTTHWNALPFPAMVAKRKIFTRPTDTSDVRVYPWAVERGFDVLMGVEHAWRDLGGVWAWGTSVFGVARKPE